MKAISASEKVSIFRFENSYLSLPEVFYKKVLPQPVPSPELILFNENLAKELEIPLPGEIENGTAFYGSVFSGNQILPGSVPIAQAYAGHQFGYFTMLGDGRAILLGEHLRSDGNRYDIQLKGSGRTPFSRGGDGRATAHSMVREYIISEAMSGLGIPTSRSLALVATGQPVYREEIHPGTVLTRIASSHIRVGTFEYAYHLLSVEDLNSLFSYTVSRHDPELVGLENPSLLFLKKVIERQVNLIVNWMRVGFIHGVMNTDNMSISGETFDYGPCAFMNAYNPATVFSSIDIRGRYSFANQPGIAQWNLACLANTLLPLIDPNSEKAIALAKSAIEEFALLFEERYWKMMNEKIGIQTVTDQTKAGVQKLLDWMKESSADYTNTFLAIESLYFESLPESVRNQFTKDGKVVCKGDWRFFTENSEFQKWFEHWLSLLTKSGQSPVETLTRMQMTNPFLIPRNHLVEEALNDVRYEIKGEFSLKKAVSLAKKLRNPYKRREKLDRGNEPPPGGDKDYRTFCGT